MFVMCRVSDIKQTQELIAIARRTYERPNDEYKAHMHFQPSTCDGRAAEAEWNEGWYFAPEFCGARDLVVYVHFERWSIIEKIDMAKRCLGFGEAMHLSAHQKEMARLIDEGNEKARMNKWWDAVWWWKKARKVEMDIEAAKSSVLAGNAVDDEVCCIPHCGQILLTVAGQCTED